MSKQLDFYAGYPNQQRMPKWVGITIGSLFGGLMLICVAVGARLLWPARTAEASVARPTPPPADQPIIAPTVAPDPAIFTASAAASNDDTHAVRTHRRPGKHGKAIAMKSHATSTKVVKQDARYKKGQLFAKRVASGSRRDKKSRDELDKLLGM